MSELVNTLDAVVAEPVALAGSLPVGQQLRQAREARGLELGDLAQALKLGPRQVESLESGDWKALPGNTFIRGFVRNYARLLQIDPAPLMLQLDLVLEKPASTLVVSDSPPPAMPHSGSAGSRRSKLMVFLGVAFVVLAALAYFLMPSNLSTLRESTQALLDSFAHKEKELDAPVVTPSVPAADPVFPPGATPQQIMNPQAMPSAESAVVPPVAAPTERVVSDANVVKEASPAVPSVPQMRFLFEKDSWLEVRDRDNKVVFSQRLSAGTEQTLAGQGPLSVKIGYAPGVRVFWHGEPVDLAPHTRGDVARLVLE